MSSSSKMDAAMLLHVERLLAELEIKVSLVGIKYFGIISVV